MEELNKLLLENEELRPFLMELSRLKKVRRKSSRNRLIDRPLSQKELDCMIAGVEDIAKVDKDPYRKNQHEAGAKLDAGKPRPWLVLGGFRMALMEVVKVGTFGAKKYSDNGWLSVPNGQSRYLDAAFRHLLAPEIRDHESDLPHLAMAIWNLLAVLELRMTGSDFGIDEE